MNYRCKHAFADFVLLTLFALPLSAAAPNNSIVSKDAEVDGIKLHYLIVGHGPTLESSVNFSERTKRLNAPDPTAAVRP
jgi:hypothetical protein